MKPSVCPLIPHVCDGEISVTDGITTLEGATICVIEDLASRSSVFSFQLPNDTITIISL